jgi:predicted RNA binding protein YcfA (HicA-like mRNA interferase family)
VPLLIEDLVFRKALVLASIGRLVAQNTILLFGSGTRISGRECVKALERAGFVIRRQEGSHIILRRGEPFAQLVVPDHKELDRGTLRAIIRQAGIAVDDEASLIIFAAQ